MTTEFNEKWVRRFTVDKNAKHKDGFTIYKITSYLFPITSPETITIVTVWKRYSDFQKLHKSIKILHAGLHLPGTVPNFTKWSYFKRFDPEVIEERMLTIKTILNFIGEHNMLFTSTDFVKFLQSGYEDPEEDSSDATPPITSIRSSLQLPDEDLPPVAYESCSDEESTHYTDAKQSLKSETKQPEVDPSKIEIYEPFDCEVRQSDMSKLSKTDSFDSLSTVDSGASLPYDEIMQIDISKIIKNKNILPDLINFDDRVVPSTSKIDDYHTMDVNNYYGQKSTDKVLDKNFSDKSVVVSQELSEISEDISSRSKYNRSDSRISVSSKRSYGGFSLVDLDVKCKTDESYVFEAGYLLNMAARAEDCCDYKKAFEMYKSGIEKMLIGVQTDPDIKRKAKIKEKIEKYLQYAEKIYKEHSEEIDNADLNPTHVEWENYKTCALPLSMLHRPYADLIKYRVLGIICDKLMLVFDTEQRQRSCIKVIQKIPHNLTIFDTVFPRQVLDVKRPILPTNVPYMVPLMSYIETPNLVFLLLSYASGGKLIDYIKKYTKSIPNTPKRVNLDNIFAEPQSAKNDGGSVINDGGSVINDGGSVINDGRSVINDRGSGINDRGSGINDGGSVINDGGSVINDKNSRNDVSSDVLSFPTRKEVQVKRNLKTNVISEKNLNKPIDKPKDSKEMTVEDMVQNAQKLLKNVNSALSGQNLKLNTVRESVKSYAYGIKEPNSNQDAEIVQDILKPSPKKGLPSDLLPPSTICKWAAEILIALENLHASGIICRDLNTSNILLGDKGHAILTYFVGYTGTDLTLSIVKRSLDRDPKSLHIAPELLNASFLDDERSSNIYHERACDFWSFGAVLYELICGFPLSHFHVGPFTSHTSLEFPEGIKVETESLLTQLLTYEPSERLGSKGIDEIKKHPYFRNVDWQNVIADFNIT